MVQFFATNEQNFNAVERMLYYTELPCEGDYTKEDDPPASWPGERKVEFNILELRYRAVLPLVLKQVSFSVRSGEKARLSS